MFKLGDPKNSRVVLSQYFSPNFFVFALWPALSITRLPKEQVKEFIGGDDWEYSATLHWLFWSITICFGRYK